MKCARRTRGASQVENKVKRVVFDSGRLSHEDQVPLKEQLAQADVGQGVFA
jgi:hypothetical protein